jgi:arylformamidase
MTMYDITRIVGHHNAVFPGDAPYQVETLASISDDVPVNLVTVTSTPHIGTHADAYFHYVANGDHPYQMPLEAYIGKARVVTVKKEAGALYPADFAHVDLVGGERLLIHSVASDWGDDVWRDDIVYPSPELIAWLANMDYKLIGMDTASVDATDSKTLDGHKAIYEHGMVNLENLVLRGVPDGDYELIALPLKLDEACASPVRAILRDWQG